MCPYILPYLPRRSADAPAEMPEVPIIPEIDDPRSVGVEIVRDLPYSYETLIENTLDVSHVPFTHHASVGNRANAGKVELEITSEGGVTAGKLSSPQP